MMESGVRWSPASCETCACYRRDWFVCCASCSFAASWPRGELSRALHSKASSLLGIISYTDTHTHHLESTPFSRSIHCTIGSAQGSKPPPPSLKPPSDVCVAPPKNSILQSARRPPTTLLVFSLAHTPPYSIYILPSGALFLFAFLVYIHAFLSHYPLLQECGLLDQKT